MHDTFCVLSAMFGIIYFMAANTLTLMGGPITDGSLRNAKLLRACLTILDKGLSLDANIERYFAEKA